MNGDACDNHEVICTNQLTVHTHNTNKTEQAQTVPNIIVSTTVIRAIHKNNTHI